MQTEERHFEDLSAKMSRKEQDLEMGKNELEEKKESWARDVEAFQVELNKLKIREDEIVPDLDPEILFKFERISFIKFLALLRSGLFLHSLNYLILRASV